MGVFVGEKATKRANGDFFAFLDVDDWWLPNKLEKQLSLFADPDVGFVCGNYWIDSEWKKKRWVAYHRRVPTGKVLGNLLEDFYVGLLTLMVQRTALEALDYPFDPRYNIIGDFDLVVRLAVHWKLGCVNEPVAYYRIHGNNETRKQRVRHIDELEHWLADFDQVDAVGTCANFSWVAWRTTYIKTMHELLEGKKWQAYRLLRSLPWGQLKIRLCLALLMPASVIRTLKN